jgi:outer membrane receptor protein involved in Fe transport
MSFLFLATRRLAWSCALSLALPANAQEAAPAPEAAPPPPDKEVEEIIVTATKREANIQEVPIAVSAFQAEELSARRIDEVEDLAQISPSINVNTSNTASAGGTLRIRGVGTTGNNIGLEAAVGTFIDGVYRSRSGQGFSDLLDLERIEVLRGPQGTLFGKNTSAGAVSIVTKRPVLDEAEGWAAVELGDFNHKRVSASFSAPIVDDVLGFRVSGLWTDRDGYYEDFHSSGAYAERDRYTLRGQLLWAPTEAIDLRLIGDYGQRDESCCPAVWVRAGSTGGRVLSAAQARGLGRDAPSVADRGFDISHRPNNKWHVGLNTAPFEKITDWGVSLEANWDLDIAKLTSISAYRKFRSRYAEDVDFTSAIVLRPQDPSGGGARDVFKNFSEEIRAQGVAFDKLDWLVGFYGYTEDVSTHSRIEWGEDAPFVILGAAVPTLLPAGEGYERGASIDTSGWALFTNNTYHVVDSFDVTIGARFGKETKEAQSVVNGAAFGSFVNDPHCQTGFFLNGFCNNLSWSNSGVTEKEWTYTFSGAYHITEDINVYYSYSRGYKAGGFNTDQDSFDCVIVDGPDADAVATALTPRPLSGNCAGLGAGPDPLLPDLTVTADNTRFSPEFAKSHELGIKGEYLDGRARINFTLFTTDFTGFQLNTFTGLGFIVSNADKARSRGAELESFFVPAEGLSINFGVTYADARYDDPNIAFNLVSPFAAATTANPIDGLPNPAAPIDHKRLTNAPAWTGSASVSYEHTLVGSEWVGFATASTAYRGRHNTGSNLHPYKFEKAHWYLNLTAGVRSPDGHWEASLWSTNLTNTYDRSIIFDTPTQSGTFHAFANPPRMWGGTLKYNF